ncbi:MAG: acyl--CoA ligase [Candidatus Aminicenantes bacterium]|nr:acyl--CoA ligase [Candidatus Aminicenantes bacterium]
MIEDALRRHAVEGGDKPAVVCGGEIITYGELDSLSDKLADSLFDRGVGRASKAALLLGNSLEFPVLYYALIKLGAIAVPLNTRYQTAELRSVLDHLEPEALLFHERFRGTVERIRPSLKPLRLCLAADRKSPEFSELLRKGRDVRPEQRASEGEEMICFYTSGTTGDPKGVVLTRRNCLSSAGMWIEAMGFSARDKLLITTPLWHCSATTAFMLSSGIVGATLILLPEFNAEDVLRTVQNQRPNFLWLVPTIMTLLDRHPRFREYDLSSLETMLSGGSPLDPETVRWWKNAQPHLAICNGYAQTEGATAGTLLRDKDVLSKPHSIGTAITKAVELKIAGAGGSEALPGATGEILMRGPHVMKGYYRNQALTEKTIKNGWLHTGDLGHFDGDGFLYYDGRKRDLIIRGGENVFSEEVEAVLSSHPAVAESAVIGVPDDVWGEVVAAVVVMKKDGRATPRDLIAHCSNLLADYKTPQVVVFVDELPKTPTGKVSKKALRDRMGARRTG